MAIKISGTTVIDNSRNISNVPTATITTLNSTTVNGTTVKTSSLKDGSDRVFTVKNAAGTIVWGG